MYLPIYLIDKKLRPSSSGLFKKLKLGRISSKTIKDKDFEKEKVDDKTSNASCGINNEKSVMENENNIFNKNKSNLNSENEIVKNYGSFNTIAELNKLTNQMAFNIAQLNTNENFNASKKSNALSKLSPKTRDLKKKSIKNEIDSSDSSYLSSLDSNLNNKDKTYSKLKSENESLKLNKKKLNVKANDKNDFEGMYSECFFLIIDFKF